MPVYVLLTKTRQRQVSLPNFAIHQTAPEVTGRDKLLTLEPGDCVDVARFTFSADSSYVEVREYCVSNIDGIAKEEQTEFYTLPKTP